MTKRQKFFSALGRFFKELFTKNIFLKIVALLFAVLLWGYVLAIENPEYTKRVRDVEIGIIGESTLNQRGFMLVTRDAGTTDVDVLCKINKHSELDASRITCTVDLASRLVTMDAEENSRKISLDVTANLPTEYGTVQSLSVTSVELEVARLSTRNNVQVSVKYIGSLPEGYTVEVPSTLSISMTGRKSLLDRIARGEVTVDLETLPINDPDTLANVYDLVLPVKFYDSSNVLLSDLVSSTGEQFTANVRTVVRAYKEVEVEPSIEMLEEGYTWRYVLSRSKVILYGERADLDKIDTIKTETITATPKMNNTPMSANLIIPAGVEMSSGAVKSVTVTLYVEELSDRINAEIPIAYQNLTAGSTLSNDVPKTVTIDVYGPLSKLKTFQTDWVTATVDLTGYAEGKISLPVQLRVDSKAYDLSIGLVSETVDVELIPPATDEEA